MGKNRLQLHVERLELRDTPSSAGSLDTTFGTGGKLTAPFAGSGPDDIHTIVQLADGRFLAAGTVTAANQDFALMRYNADGSLDTTFGTNGYITTDFGADEMANAVAVQADGKIVVAGHTTGGMHGDIAMARYNADGSLDTTFGTGGKVIADSGSDQSNPFDDTANSVEIQNGKILVHGVRTNLAIMAPTPLNESAFDAQFNADGTIDTTFGTNGFNVKPLMDMETAIGFSSVLPLPGGKTLLVGSHIGVDTGSDFVVKRFNADGTLDTTFGTGGRIELNLQPGQAGSPIHGSADVAYRAALQADGKIIVVGSSDAGSGPKFAIVRLNSDGSLDSTWGKNGIAITDIDGNMDTALNAAIQPDGKVLVMGESVHNGDAQLVLARYLGQADAPPPAPKPQKHWLVVGTDGGKPEVKVYDPLTNALKMDFMAYNRAFTGGVHVATADVNGDGIDDIITGAGPGGGPHVEVFDGATGQLIMSFFAYDPSFAGGVYVAAADVNGDGHADIITGAGAGGGPHVKVFDGATGQIIQSFFAYNPVFTGGVRVAAGDVNGDGHADIVTGAGIGGGPHVEVFDGMTGAILRSFFAFDPSFSNGVFVAAGDLNGDGHDEVIVSQGRANGPHVHVYDGATGMLTGDLMPFAPRGDSLLGRMTLALDSLRLATVDRDGDGIADLVIGAGPHRPASVLTYKGTTLSLIGTFTTYDPTYAGGIFVA
jgi:uncharacterized delta-60 repeat protein